MEAETTNESADVEDGAGGGEDLLTSISAWRYVIPILGIALVTAYFVWFRDQPSATDPDKWGTFGDYFGGIMNPIVAFAAFYWLTQSVKLQKEELAATRKELKGATRAQQELVSNGRQSVELSALAALLNGAYAEITRIQAVTDAITRNRPEDRMGIIQKDYDQRHEEALRKLNIARMAAVAERDQYQARMKEILRVHSPKPTLEVVEPSPATPL